MSSNVFDIVAERVFRSLKSEMRIQLKKDLAKRLSSDPIHYLKNSCPEKDKLKILKLSLISTLRQFEKNANHSQHLLLLLFDVMAEQVQTEPSNLRVNHSNSNSVNGHGIGDSSPRKKLRKQLTPKRVVSQEASQNDVVMDVVEGVPVFHTDDIPIISTTQESPVIQCGTSSLPAPIPIELETKIVSFDVKDSQSENKSEKAPKKKRKKVARSESSIKAAATCNKEVPVELSEMSPWEVIWNMNAYACEQRTFEEEWLGRSPDYFGIKCSRSSVGLCDRCITTLLMSPVTSCDAVGCEKKVGYEPHSTTDFNLSQMHDDVSRDNILCQYIPSMFGRDFMPSMFYTQTHNKNAQKSRSPMHLLGKLNKCVDYYQRMFSDLHTKVKR